jgi:hypothetical protein
MYLIMVVPERVLVIGLLIQTVPLVVMEQLDHCFVPENLSLHRLLQQQESVWQIKLSTKTETKYNTLLQFFFSKL